MDKDLKHSIVFNVIGGILWFRDESAPQYIPRIVRNQDESALRIMPNDLSNMDVLLEFLGLSQAIFSKPTSIPIFIPVGHGEVGLFNVVNLPNQYNPSLLAIEAPECQQIAISYSQHETVYATMWHGINSGQLFELIPIGGATSNRFRIIKRQLSSILPLSE